MRRLKRPLTFSVVFLFILFSCNQFTGDETEQTGQTDQNDDKTDQNDEDDYINDSKPLNTFSVNIGVTEDSISPETVNYLDSNESGEYENGDTFRAVVRNDGMLFNGWYDAPVDGELINRRNPYEMFLNGEKNLYAQFLQGPIYPADNSDDYTPGVDWALSWQDEFNNNDFYTNPDDDSANNWDRETNEGTKRKNGEWQDYTGTEDTAYESDGYLIIEAKHVDEGHDYHKYTSARVISNPGGKDGTSGSKGFTFKYGKLAARIQLPYGKGIWPAFWLLGDSISETGGDIDWPSCGEIDILETGFRSNPDTYYGHSMIGGTIHYDTSVDNSEGYSAWNFIGEHTTLENGIYADKFRVYELEWNETELIWRIDGEEYHRQDISGEEFSEFKENFYIIFNIAVGGNLTDNPDDTTTFPATMYVDWVRHYTKG